MTCFTVHECQVPSFGSSGGNETPCDTLFTQAKQSRDLGNGTVSLRLESRMGTDSLILVQPGS